MIKKTGYTLDELAKMWSHVDINSAKPIQVALDFAQALRKLEEQSHCKAILAENQWHIHSLD